MNDNINNYIINENTEDKIFTKLLTNFYKIEKKGWIESKYKGNGAIGMTLEDEFGVENNSIPFADIDGIELKSKTIKKENTIHYPEGYGPRFKEEITLFSATFDGESPFEIEKIRNLFGRPDKDYPNINVLYLISRIGKKINYSASLKSTELRLEKEEKKLYLDFYDENKNKIYNKAYWELDSLKEKLKNKLSYLAYIKAERKKENETIFFHYKELNLYQQKSFDTFLELLQKGIIYVNLKVGVVKSGYKKGKINYHGISFVIEEKNLNKLFDLKMKYIGNNININYIK